MREILVRGKRGFLWSLMGVGLMLFALGAPAETRSKKPTSWRVTLQSHFKKKDCYRAMYLVERQLRQIKKAERRSDYMLLVARCFMRKSSGYSSYARRYYQKAMYKGMNLSRRLEATLGLLQASIHQVYSYSGRYYERRRKAYRKRLIEFKALLNKHKMPRHSRWRGELRLLRGSFALKRNAASQAYREANAVWRGGYPQAVREKAALFLAERVMGRYAMPGMDANANLRRIAFYRKIIKKLRLQKNLAKAYCQLGLLLVYVKGSFDKGLAALRRSARWKGEDWGSRAASQLERFTTPRVTPKFSLQIPPNTPQKWSLSFSRLKKATLKIYRVDLPAVFAKIGNVFDLTGLTLKSKALVLSRELSIPHAAKLNWPMGNQVSVDFQLGGIAPGSYALEISGTNHYQRGSTLRMPLFVSHAQFITKQARDSLLVALVDARDNRPVADAPLKLGLQGQYRRVKGRSVYLSKDVVSQKTDSMGIFSHSFAKPIQGRNIQVISCSKMGCTYGQTGRTYGYRGHWYRRRYHGWYYSYTRLMHNLFWTTDRGAYRPGQEVHFKGIYHRQQYHKWQSSKDRRIRVRMFSPKGKKYFEKIFVLDEMGTFDGTVSLSKSSELGKHTVNIESLYKKASWSQWSTRKSFRVEEYRRPKFVVRTVLASGTYSLGDVLRWKISANYTFGGPVKYGKVSWKLFREEASPEFSFPRPFSWYFKQKSNTRYRHWRYRHYNRYRKGNHRYWFEYYKRLTDQYHGYMLRYPNQRYYRNVYERYRRLMGEHKRKLKPMARGVGKLNAKGELRIKVPSGRGAGYWKYILMAEVTDSSRRTIPGKGSTLLGKKGAIAYLRTTKQIVLPGEKVVVLLRTLRPGGEGVAAKGKLYIIGASKKGKPAVIAEQSLKVSTNQEGKGLVKFVADYLGHFRLVFVGRLANGQKIKASGTVWLGSEKLRHTDYPYKKLEVVTDRDLYKIGERGAILINSPLLPNRYLVTVEGDGLFWSSMVKTRGKSTVTRFPIKKSYAPNVWVTVTYLFKGQLHQARQRIVVPPLDRFLSVKVLNLKKSYKPGTKVKWRLKVVDYKGNPVKSELLLFAYDQSLDLIGKVELPDIRKSFYDRQQNISIATKTSVQSMRGYRHRLIRRDYKESKKDSSLDDSGRGGGRAAPKPIQARRSSSKRKRQKVVSEESSQKRPQDFAKAKKRTDFRETAVWLAKIRTDANGAAVAEFQWPDSLTTWSVRAVAIGTGVRVAAIEKTTKTNKRLMVEIAAPRFFTVGDRVHVAVLAYNRGPAQKIRVRFRASGLKLLGSGTQHAKIGANDNHRFVFQVKASAAGPVRLWAEVASGRFADAMEIKRKVLAFGLDRIMAQAGASFKKETRVLNISIPSRFSKNTGRLELSLSSSLTRSVFDSLGYLVKFPYGCVEQTMSRFLPAALAAKTFAGLDKTDPKLAKKLPKVIEAGLQRLYNFQHSDGGWGWWRFDDTNDFMTAYVIFGLSIAREAGYKIDAEVLSRGATYLRKRLKDLRPKPSLHAYSLYALSLVGRLPKAEVDFSLGQLKKLNAYGIALLAMAYKRRGDAASTKYVIEKLHEKMTVVQAGGEAYFPGAGTMRGWSEDGIEATAVALRALIRSGHYKRDWPRIARWLLRNRKGRRWNSTRDTAQAILALAAFAKATGEGRGERKVDLVIDGKIFGKYMLLPNDPKLSGLRLVLDDARLRRGIRKIQILNVSGGPLYYGMSLRYRTEESRIKAGGSGILSIRRTYYRVTWRKGKPVYRKISSGRAVKAGSEIEVRLRIQAKNRLQYLLFSDRKPAGLEPVQFKSGRPTARWLSHQEFRDTHVAFFAGALKAKKSYKLSYRMRAERPGRYRTLPTVGAPMYVPAANGHSGSFLFVIKP